MASGPLPQKSGVSTGAKPGRPEQGANQNFLVLLLASLGPEQETPVAASDALAGSPDEAPPGKQATSEASSRPPVRDTHGLSGRETSKAPPVAARPAEVAYVAPAPAGLPATSFAGLTLDFAMDSRSGDGFDLSQSGESGTMFSTGTRGTLPPTELVSGAAAPNTARIDSASTSDVRSATHKSFPEDAPASAPAAGQTAFEARIQFSASGHPDELAPTVADGPPKVAATGEPAGGSGNQVMGLAIAASSSHAGSTQVSNHRDIGTAGAAKPLTDRGGNPSSGEASATDGTNPDSAGEEQPDSASPKKDSGDPAGPPLDDSLRAADPQISAATVAATGPGLDSAVAAAQKSVPPAAPAGQDMAADSPPTAAASAPTKDIAIQLQDPGGARVDVQVMDRAGTVHVVVRTQDDGLARDLRTNLPDLAQKLNQQGMEADAWSPVEMHNASGGHENSGHAHERGSEDSHASAGGQDSPGGDGGQPRRRRPGPDDKLDKTFSGLLTGATAWQPTR